MPAVSAQASWVRTFQDVERDQRRDALPVRRDLVQVDAPVPCLDRRRPSRDVGVKVGLSQRPTERLHQLHNGGTRAPLAKPGEVVSGVVM